MVVAIKSSNDLTNVEEQFHEQGYVILKGVLEPPVVAGARAAMEQLVEEHAGRLLAGNRIDSLMENEPFESRLAALYRDNLDIAPKSFRKELHLKGLYDVFFNEEVLNVAETILGDEIRLYPNYTARPKLPDWEGTVVLWHQDGGYTEGNVNELRMMNVWSPLVPARRENGCMQFVPGTHRLGVVPHVDKEHYKEIAPEFLRVYEDQAILVELDPGDVVLFHNLLFHRGLPNHSKTIRWSLDWRYQDATQPTMRPEKGHLARSKENSIDIVSSREDWEGRTFA